ncbi:PREDICTED: uncharacterized protein LOC104709781 [Camelina sativa]|uniref:Uncharacterized protein LOC104709781 n=1 Tax=Camelina sativa TaxID=90675 RepID=A0ABM0TDB3_CAMSA|nr:PREDICTED: uncharacterized protein LOC104709781 [Camelina sativa]
MKLLIDTQRGSSFFIDVHFLDTVLRMKEMIEESLAIPVYKQTLFFQGKVLQDPLHYFECNIPENSRLFLSISPGHNPNQYSNDLVPQTEQSSSNPIHGFVHNQDLPVMMSNKYQVPGRIQKVMARRIDNGSSRPSYSLDELLAPQDFPPVTVGSTRNRYQEVVQPEQCSSSDSVKEVINIPDSPVRSKTIPSIKLTVFVKPFEETRMIPVEVNAGDDVEELMKELVKMKERGELNLPLEWYYFILRGRILLETKSFMWNHVADGDTIELKLFAASSYFV